MLADPDAVQISADGSCYPKEGRKAGYGIHGVIAIPHLHLLHSQVDGAFPRKLAGRRYDKVFFGCIVVLLLLIVFVGFARSYYLAGVFRAPLPAPILHIHGALNTLWMLLRQRESSAYCCDGTVYLPP